MRRGLLLLAALAALAARAGAQPQPLPDGLTVSGRVDWSSATLVIDASQALDPSVDALPRAKEAAQASIQDRLDELFARSMEPLVVDSSHTLGQILASDRVLATSVAALAEQVPSRQSALSRDFSALTVRYVLPLFGDGGILAPLIPSQANPPRRRLSSVSTRRFTGLLIWAKGPLPDVGARGTRVARPAVFPRIWDPGMNLVLDKGMVNPEDLARWGMVGYAESLEDSATLRAGASPLRLTARGVFGDNATDLVISSEGAAELLSLPENIAALAQGRVVIVYDSLK
jgi:hypothetical protein